MKGTLTLTGLIMAGLILAGTTLGGSKTVRILIYKDPGFQQDWASSGPEGDYKTILVTNPNSQDLTDFQVKLVFDPSSDSFFDSCQGGSLLGIWTGNGSRQVPFWVENWSATQAIVWFKAPVLAASGTTRLRLYCSEDKAGTPDGESTFVFFDDFEDGDWSDKWQAVGIDGYWVKVLSVVGPYGQQEKALTMCGGGSSNSDWRGVKTIEVLPDHTVVEVWRKSTGYSAPWGAGCSSCGGWRYFALSGWKPNTSPCDRRTKQAGFKYSQMSVGYCYRKYCGNPKCYGLNSGSFSGEWQDWKRVRFFVDGTHLIAEFGTDRIETFNLDPSYAGDYQLLIGSVAWSPPGTYVSSVAVRKYADSEPVAVLQ